MQPQSVRLSENQWKESGGDYLTNNEKESEWGYLTNNEKRVNETIN